MKLIRRHYDHVRVELRVNPDETKALPSRVHSIVLVSNVHKPVLRALAFARATRPDTLVALTVNVDDNGTRKLQEQWDRFDIPLPLVIMLRDLGPLPHDSLRKTGWKPGDRLVDLDTKLPVKLGDLDIGGIKTVMPEGFTTVDEFALAPTMLIRFGPNEILSKREISKGYENHVAYSKICTHAGCPISLYERDTHNLLCPCHQSTFDMARDAKVIFGPAARPLPQLAITVDDEGYFRALGEYSQPVGPSFWERR